LTLLGTSFFLFGLECVISATYEFFVSLWRFSAERVEVANGDVMEDRADEEIVDIPSKMKPSYCRYLGILCTI
jgi:hypothetical protein